MAHYSVILLRRMVAVAQQVFSGSLWTRTAVPTSPAQVAVCGRQQAGHFRLPFRGLRHTLHHLSPNCPRMLPAWCTRHFLAMAVIRLGSRGTPPQAKLSLPANMQELRPETTSPQLLMLTSKASGRRVALRFSRNLAPTDLRCCIPAIFWAISRRPLSLRRRVSPSTDLITFGFPGRPQAPDFRFSTPYNPFPQHRAAASPLRPLSFRSSMSVQQPRL